MNRYLIKRLLLIVPTLLVISVFAFLLSKTVPQDPVLTTLNLRGHDLGSGVNNRSYAAVYKELGFDKPNFYISVVPNHYPASLNVISDFNKKAFIKNLLKAGFSYDDALEIATSQNIQKYSQLAIPELANKFSNQYHIKKIFFPCIHWHGLNNQYHHWLSSFLKGDSGISIINGERAFSQVSKALIWTIHIALPSIIFSFLVAILLAYLMAKNEDKKIDKWISQTLYLLFAIPTFWLATMLVMYFTTDNYGTWTNIFPSVGMDIYPEMSTVKQVWKNIYKLILPILIASLSAIAYISRILRRSILDEMESPYITTAYSKGLDSSQVIRKHALPNSLLPFISILAGTLPATVGGSVVLEVIFNIPGIGRLLYFSIEQADWNVVFCIILIIGIVNILSYLLADFLYALANPKIRYE